MIGQGEDLYENGSPPDWSKETWARCRMSRNRCFPAGLKASEIFKHVLYTQPEPCGDCIISALLNESGKLGLEAFLPPPHRIHYSSTKGRIVKDVDPDSIPRLPLTKRPGDASFKLKDVMREWDTVRVRDWVVRAMGRYRFVLGASFFEESNRQMLTGYVQGIRLVISGCLRTQGAQSIPLRRLTR